MKQGNIILLQKNIAGDFPYSPVVRNLPSNAGDMGSIPGQETKIPHATECGQLKRKLQMVGNNNISFLENKSRQMRIDQTWKLSQQVTVSATGHTHRHTHTNMHIYTCAHTHTYTF